MIMFIILVADERLDRSRTLCLPVVTGGSITKCYA